MPEWKIDQGSSATPRQILLQQKSDTQSRHCKPSASRRDFRRRDSEIKVDKAAKDELIQERQRTMDELPAAVEECNRVTWTISSHIDYSYYSLHM